MRNFILALALALPLALVGCNDSATDETAAPGDMEDVVGDGEIIDEPGEMEAGDDMMGTDDMMDEGAPMGDSADVIGDGEVIDEAGEPDADALGQ